MRQPRHRLLAAALSALVLVAAGCGGDDGGEAADGGPVTLTFANWASAEDATRDGMLDLIKQFESANPDIKIESESVPFSDIGQNLVLRVNSGNPPDVAQISGNDTFAVAATGGLADLDESLADVKGMLIPEDVEMGTIDGTWVAMPWKDSPQGFFYNRKLMEEAGLDPESPPATIDELDQAMEQIKREKPGVIPLGTDTTNRTFGLASQWPWMLAHGAQPFDESTATADTPEMRAYLEWISGVVKNDYTLPNRRIGDFRPLAAQDEVAFIVDQPLLQGVIQSTNDMSDNEFHETWGVTTLPQGATGESYSVPLGHQLVMFNKAADDGKAEAAAKFMQFLATDPKAIEEFTIGVESSLPPIAEPSPEIQQLLDTPLYTAFQEEILPTSTLPLYGQAFSAGSTPVMAGVQTAFSDEPVDSVATQMQAQLEGALGG
ncbi:MAG: ABC transporter substrate-binding protein [Solirubrobacteraceae bacterium]